MGLPKDTISINLAKGVNTKTDDKITGNEQSSVINDARFDKDMRLVKRNGLTAQGTTTITSFPNPTGFGTSALPTKTFAHENQLLVENQGQLYSQYEGQNSWVFKGNYFPIQVSSTRVSGSVTFIDSVTSSGMTALAGNGVGFGSASNAIYLREDATGNIIFSGTKSNVLRLVSFSNAIWILSGVGSTLSANQISFTTGSIGAPVVLQTDLGTGGLSNPASISVTHTSASSTIGEAAFISYRSGTTSKIFPMNSSGSIPALGTLNVGTNAGGQLTVYCEPSVNPNAFYFFNGVQVWGYTFGIGSYAPQFTSGTVFSSTFSQAGTYTFSSTTSYAISMNPVDTTKLFVFQSSYAYPGQISGTSATTSIDSSLYYAALNASTGSVTIAQSLYGQGYMLAANAIYDSSRQSIYLPCTVETPLQSTYLLLDVLKGRANTTTWVQGKWLYGQATQSTYLSQCLQTTVGGSTYRFTNNGNICDINLAPTTAPSSQYFAKTSHLTGGLLWAYDGQTLSEHNFLIAPEIVDVWCGTLSANILAYAPGSVSSPQYINFQFGNGASNYSGYIGISAPSGIPKDWYIWFTTDGTGSDPAPGGRTAIPVSLNSTDTQDEVAQKVFQSVNNVVSSSQFNYSFPGTGQFAITAQNNGTATAPTLNTTMISPGAGFSGTLSAGSYQWSAVYRWTDRNGQVYRSAPSIPISATATLNSFASLVVTAPAITNHTPGEVYVELYRTAANGVEFQLESVFAPLNGTVGIPTMSGTATRVIFRDIVADAAIASNVILYTNGGILENNSIGACSAVSYFKERLQVCGTDDPLAIYYSNSVIAGQPVNFSQELFYRVDADQNPVKAVFPMDDKAVIFKPNGIYIVSGDGANELGENSSLTPPLLIAGDVGTSYPNSVVLYPGGLLFKSDKGIYSISRGLSTQYTGAPVEAYNSNKVSGAILMDSLTEIRFPLQDTNLGLIYNYYFNRWDYFTNYQSDSACLWQNTLVLGQNSGIVNVESSNYYDLNVSGGTVSYSEYYESPWLKLKGIQDFQRIYQLIFLGEWLAPHTLTVALLYDYDTSNSDTFTFNATTQPSGAYQFKLYPKRQKCESLKIKITENSGVGSQQGLILNQIDAYVGLKQGLMKLATTKAAT